MRKPKTGKVVCFGLEDITQDLGYTASLSLLEYCLQNAFLAWFDTLRYSDTTLRGGIRRDSPHPIYVSSAIKEMCVISGGRKST